MINYEENFNCINNFDKVESKLLYGDLSCIEKPFITVLVPTYKRVGFLQDALISLLRQYHCDFLWDIIVLDNEDYDGSINDTEKLIRKINNKRILYYRNTEHLRPGDNFNRGIKLARGKWVMMLHDDDLLFYNTVQYIGRCIQICEAQKLNLGAIASNHYQFAYNLSKEQSSIDLEGISNYFSSLPNNYNLYRITKRHSLVCPDVGGDIPTCGTCFNRDVVLKLGGFNDDFGICADQVLFYNILKDYILLQPSVPIGFWRWTDKNNSSQIDNMKEVVRCQLDFKKYIYRKNIKNFLFGLIFKNCHYKILKKVLYKQAMLGDKKDFDSKVLTYENLKDPSKIVYFIYLVRYWFYKRNREKQAIKFGKKCQKIKEKYNIS